MNNKDKGNLASSMGGLAIIFGIISMVLKSSNLVIFTSLIAGILLTAYGIVVMSKSDPK